MYDKSHKKVSMLLMTRSHWFAKNVESDFFFSRIVATKNEAESNSENKQEYKACQILLRLNQWRRFETDKYCKLFYAWTNLLDGYRLMFLRIFHYSYIIDSINPYIWEQFPIKITLNNFWFGLFLQHVCQPVFFFCTGKFQ